MAHYNEITHQELDLLLNIVRDDNPDFFNAELMNRFFAMNETIHKKLVLSNIRSIKKAQALEKKLESFKAAAEREIPQEGFSESGMTSTEVGTMLLFHLQKLQTYKLSRTKLVLILYEMYASWLYSKEQRLVDETPLATDYGPTFRKVMKTFENVYARVPFKTYSELSDKNPAIARFCENAARKYYDWSTEDIKKKLTQNKAYTNADAKHNKGNWYNKISDHDIFEWRKSLK